MVLLVLILKLIFKLRFPVRNSWTILVMYNYDWNYYFPFRYTLYINMHILTTSPLKKI